MKKVVAVALMGLLVSCSNVNDSEQTEQATASATEESAPSSQTREPAQPSEPATPEPVPTEEPTEPATEELVTEEPVTDEPVTEAPAEGTVFVTENGTYQWRLPPGYTLELDHEPFALDYANGELSTSYSLIGPNGSVGGILINPGTFGDGFGWDEAEPIDEVQIDTPADNPAYVRSELVTDCWDNPDCPSHIQMWMNAGERDSTVMFSDTRGGQAYGAVGVFVALPEGGTTKDEARAFIGSPDYQALWDFMMSFEILK